jgi:TolB-like protein
VNKRPGLSFRRFWEELRRRRVVQMAIYYAAFAWIVIQVGDVVFDAFDMHQWQRFLVAAVVAVFPVVLLLSWIFDLTPGGIERTQPLETPGEAPAGSLAVLPFVNLSDDVENEYFSDGLSEEIRNRLARVPGLRVAARTSSFSFKNRNEDIREIGRRLNVAVVLEGGVRKQAGTVRINIQLVNATDGYQVWSEHYERDLQVIFRLQTEIAQAVTEKIRPLTRAASPVPATPDTASFDAYNLYLRGRHHFHRRTAASLHRAVAYFEQAIDLDANYALAWSALGDACTLLSSRFYGNDSVEKAVSRAMPAALRAIELNPGLPEAHATLGLVYENQGDLSAAEKSFLHSLDLSPSYTMALVWYGLVLVQQRRFREAADRNNQALQLDPLSPIINVNVGFDALRYGDIEKARSRFATAIEIDAAFPVSHYGMARAHSLDLDFDAALEAIDRAIESAPERAYYPARKALMLLQMERFEEAVVSIEKACCMSPDNPFDADLMIAFHMLNEDRSDLEQVARGETRRVYSPEQRGQAFIALGDYRQALVQYEAASLDVGRELIDLITDDWIWRCPHIINRAHLWLREGDPRGEAGLQALLDELEIIKSQDIVNPLAHYWAACVHNLLRHEPEARDAMSEARRTGWHHPWWESRDWNLQPPAWPSRPAS